MQKCAEGLEYCEKDCVRVVQHDVQRYLPVMDEKTADAGNELSYCPASLHSYLPVRSRFMMRV